MDAKKSAKIKRFLEFGQLRFGHEWGWKKRYANELGISSQHLNVICRTGSLGGIIEAKMSELGCNMEWFKTGENKPKKICSKNDEELLQRLGEMGVRSVAQLNQLFSPENMAKDIAMVLRERQVVYNMKRKKKS